jgi:hypothetical protein
MQYETETSSWMLTGNDANMEKALSNRGIDAGERLLFDVDALSIGSCRRLDRTRRVVGIIREHLIPRKRLQRGWIGHGDLRFFQKDRNITTEAAFVVYYILTAGHNSVFPVRMWAAVQDSL